MYTEVNGLISFKLQPNKNTRKKKKKLNLI